MTQESEQLVVENALIHYEDGKHTCRTTEKVIHIQNKIDEVAPTLNRADPSPLLITKEEIKNKLEKSGYNFVRVAR